MDKKERIKRSFLIIVIMTIALISIMNSRAKREKKKEKEKEQIVETIGNYNVDIIKVTNIKSKEKNYLISPYNIEIALNMLREGALGNTKIELDKVLGNRKINDIKVSSKLNIANAVFIKDEYKNDVKKDFINTLREKYQSEVLYDKFETPTVINNWVKEKTNDMIPKLLDEINKDYVIGLASALALDVEWESPFKCINTKEEDFTKIDNKKMKVEMMHQTYEHAAKYFKNDDLEGIILPYKTDNEKVNLEFVAILPKTNPNDYINNLTQDKLDSMFTNIKEASSNLHIHLSLPRFTYDYEVEDFIEVLKQMGIKEAFDENLANFKKMIEIKENVYVGEAIHKTKIELNEKGTKAAAVTYFGMFKSTGLPSQDFEEIDISFNKPFVYMIREKNTGEILFFGTVFEPNKWNNPTCEIK